jgi:hypothetical protein
LTGSREVGNIPPTSAATEFSFLTDSPTRGKTPRMIGNATSLYSTAQTVNQVQPAQEMPAIIRAVEQIDAETKGMRSLYDALNSKLERVLRPVPATPMGGQGVGKATDNCPLAEALFAQREHFTETRVMIEQLIDRIQL